MGEPWKEDDSEFQPPQDDVFGLIDNAINQADGDNTAFLRERPELGTTVAAFQQWARDAVASADLLRPSDGIHAVELEELQLPIPPEARGQVARGDVVRPFVQVELAREGHRRMLAAESRMPELLDRLVDVPLPPRAEMYLGRAARLYLWQFDSEVAAISRAVFESALSTVVSDADVRCVVDDASRRRFVMLGHRLEAAKRIRHADGSLILESDIAVLAEDLVEAGNDFLHERPPRSRETSLKAPLDILTGLARLLAHVLR